MDRKLTKRAGIQRDSSDGVTPFSGRAQPDEVACRMEADRLFAPAPAKREGLRNSEGPERRCYFIYGTSVLNDTSQLTQALSFQHSGEAA